MNKYKFKNIDLIKLRQEYIYNFVLNYITLFGGEDLTCLLADIQTCFILLDY